MCLSRITKITHNEGEGYKLFLLHENDLHPLFKKRNLVFKTEEWYVDNNNIEILCWCYKDQLYQAGYHVFTNYNFALRYLLELKHNKHMLDFNVSDIVIKKVKYKNVVASGFALITFEPDTIVAKEMYIEDI